MFGPKKHPTVSHFIGAPMHVAGDCHFQGALRLDGTIVGDVIADDSQPSRLHIGPSGHVQGNVRADHVIVAGTIVGIVQASEHLELRATARIEGDVSYQGMDMQAGATVIGDLQPQPLRIKPEPQPPAAAPRETDEPEAVPEAAETADEEPGTPAAKGPEKAATEPREPTLDLQQPLSFDEPGH